MTMRGGSDRATKSASWTVGSGRVVRSAVPRRVMAVVMVAAALGGTGDVAARQTGDDTTGSWTARVAEDGALRLEVSRWDEEGSWRSGVSLTPDATVGILAAAGRNDGVVEFDLAREAGTLSFQGRLRGDRGTGEFRFVEDREFRETMRDLGYGRLDEDQVFAAALLDVGPRHARSMEALGLRGLDFDELVSSRIFQVDADFLADMEAVGFGDLDFDQLISFRVFEIDGESVRAARASGVGPLDADDVVAMKVHGITAKAVDEALGMFPGADFDDVVAMRIHDITPEFVREAENMGFGPRELDDVMAMKIHGLTRAYVASMSDVGVDLYDFDDAIAFRVHGIDADFVQELRDEGLSDLDQDELLRIRIHGLDEILRKRRRSQRR